MITVVVPQVIQPRLGETQLQLTAQLREHERLQQPAHQVSVPQHRLNPELQRTSHKSGICDIAFGYGRAA
jgi:hypothetical protein